ncbi:MAG: coiled-coil protein [Thermoplasmataceae archaeon]
MTELLSEIEQRRELFRQIVEEHVRKRDNAGAEASKNADERDILNAKVKELREQAKKLISDKAALIEQVQKLRPEKEKAFGELAELRKDYRMVREGAGGVIDIKEIRIRERELQKLIKKQETTELNKTEEQKVVSEIRRLNNEIKKMKVDFESSLLKNDRIREVNTKINEKKREAESMKKEVEAISTSISALSEEINTMLQELDEIRRKSDEYHELFIKFSKESEKEHQAFIQAKTALKDLEKEIYSVRSKEKNSRRKEKDGELQQKASVLFDKFKNGEQLTTEDLLILQKAGFL